MRIYLSHLSELVTYLIETAFFSLWLIFVWGDNSVFSSFCRVASRKTIANSNPDDIARIYQRSVFEILDNKLLLVVHICKEALYKYFLTVYPGPEDNH